MAPPCPTTGRWACPIAKPPWECDEEALLPGKNSSIWWLGLRPNHHMDGSLLRARRSFITLPVWRVESS
jgi:hypothetical protein